MADGPKLARRRFLQLVAAATVLPATARAQQSYPSRPVRVVVGFPPGSSADIVSRLMAQWLASRLGQPFVTENRPGAGGAIGTETVVREAPDGHTLLWATSANAISATFYPNLSFNFLRDIASVASVGRMPLVMVVHPSFPAKTIPDFISYAKANPGKINMASGGNGGTLHVTGELFKMMTGVEMTHVPYRGDAPALTDLIAGQVQVLFATMPAAVEHVRAGRLRALGVTHKARSDAMPDVPAIAEFVPGYESSVWHGVGAPKGTPVDIIDKLNKEVGAGLADPGMKARLADLGTTGLTMSPAEYAQFVADETEKWGKVVKFSGAKPN
jgi:tripartite-type tricarboxylate transporter receptor subunit TctC